MKLDSTAIEEFKDYLIQSTNEDVYYQLKDWVDRHLDEDQDYGEALDFFANNLTGSLSWTDDN
tara:strand:- start:5 stop:193 length:189 start_codon:yes stop_codon:yes gene_type:complete